jgi:hypothetical protein
VRRVLVLLAAGLLAVSLAAPASVGAGGSTYQVPRPHGPDDTAAVQAGLDWCVKHGPGCTVQLQAGTYRTSQLLAYNFRGTFRGAGQNRTTIEALPKLAVTGPDFWKDGACAPNLTDCRWADFIIFVNGNVEVSDLALDFPATNGNETTPFPLNGNQVVGLSTALEFTGDARADASVDRVSITGRADHMPSSVFGVGFNVAQGIMFDGWFPVAPYPNTETVPRGGTFAVRNSTVRSVWDAVIAGGALTGSRITIGGSPETGNRIDNVDIGIDVGAANSMIDVSYNNVAADNAATEEINHDGVLVEPPALAGPFTHMSQVSVRDNAVTVSDACGCMMVGIHLFDAILGSTHWFTGSVKHNTVSLPSTYVLPGEGKEGIDANNVSGLLITGNKMSGKAAGTMDAISLWGNDPSWAPAQGNVVSGNDVSGLKPMGSQLAPDMYPGLGLSQYYLDPYATHNLVACARGADTAYDGGSGNKVIGCTMATLPLAATQKVSPLLRQASPTSRLKLPRMHR